MMLRRLEYLATNGEDISEEEAIARAIQMSMDNEGKGSKQSGQKKQ